MMTPTPLSAAWRIASASASLSDCVSPVWAKAEASGRRKTAHSAARTIRLVLIGMPATFLFYPRRKGTKGPQMAQFPDDRPGSAREMGVFSVALAYYQRQRQDVGGRGFLP